MLESLELFYEEKIKQYNKDLKYTNKGCHAYKMLIEQIRTYKLALLGISSIKHNYYNCLEDEDKECPNCKNWKYCTFLDDYEIMKLSENVNKYEQ